ncbi:MAG: LysR family transcriptional regulator, partial [Actinomycetia bacterium]|nr:LysR family transcriptional regulator [Actinomycetes bacterium]
MDLNYFKTFITVVDRKGFSQAAKLLNLTQPAVSFQVQSLEKHYQITLIDRSSYKFKLTEVGQIFYKTSKKLLDTEKKLSDEVDTYKEKVGGELILGASNIPGEYILPGILGGFKKINPEVKVSLEIGDTAEIIDNIVQHHIDLGFIGSVPDKGNLEYKKFKTDELLLVVPKGHAFLKKPFTLDDLCSEPFIIREEGSG